MMHIPMGSLNGKLGNEGFKQTFSLKHRSFLMDICCYIPGDNLIKLPTACNDYKASPMLPAATNNISLKHINFQWCLKVKRKNTPNRILPIKYDKSRYLEQKYQRKELCLKTWNRAHSKDHVKLKRNLFVNLQKVKIPKTWNPIQSHTCNLFDVEKDSEEYNMIQSTFMETMEGSLITRIQRIQNLIAYQRYYSTMAAISATSDPNEMFLFHGTRYSSPRAIICDQNGFDERLSGNQNLWGKGIYFAEDANYVDSFCFGPNSQTTKFLIVASVLVGDCFDYNTICNPTLTAPPINIKTRERYHSIAGVTKGSRIRAIYNASQCCPRYVISYKS